MSAWAQAAASSAQAIVVIPALNEEATIGSVVEEVLRQGYPVIVVNDDSQDGTSAAARAAGAVVLDLPCRLGAWGATQAGMRLGLRTGYQAIVTLDGDGQHQPSDIGALVALIAGGTAEIAIGSCLARASAARQVAWRLFKVLSGLEVQDLTSGFRAYSRSAARAMMGAGATLADYQDLGVLLLASRRAFRVREVPVRMRSRAVGNSHIFSSWLRVGRYMVYTLTIACTQRSFEAVRLHSRRPRHI